MGDKPYVIWSDDIERDNIGFLDRVDANFYYRTVTECFIDADETGSGGLSEDDEERKKAAPLARLLWHHGAETLVMMLGAYMQAPGAVHAYFLKCRTEDAVEIAKGILAGDPPKHNRLNDAPLSAESLIRGIHAHASWVGKVQTEEHFSRALRRILKDFAAERHRWEYNSIKHGLRTGHGQIAIAVGIQDAPGIPAPEERMEVVAASRDSSFFDVAKPIPNASKKQSKVNFKIDHESIGWSLERVVCELQLMSILISNIVSALKIVAGAMPPSVQFNWPGDIPEWWELYFSHHGGSLMNLGHSTDMDAKGKQLPDSSDVFKSYRKQE